MAGLLILASLGGQFAKFALGHDYLKGLVPLFSVDAERNVPTFFSLLLLLSTALLLAVIAVHSRKQRAPHGSKWAILSLGFVCMAYDEAFEVHEKLIEPLRALRGDADLGIFYFAWVVPGIALVVVLALFFLRFLIHLPARTRRRFLTAASLYLGGAIGVELVGGRHAEIHGLHGLAYGLLVTVEEGLEMAGLVVFIWALLKYWGENRGELRLRVEA